MSVPCGWSITGCGCGTSCWDTMSPDAKEYAEAVACQIMWAGTGRQYGLCEITVRPCNRTSDPLYVDYPVEASGLGVDYATAYIAQDGQWHNAGCGASCSCTGSCEIALDGPTTTAGITSVHVAGVLVPPAAYEVHNAYLLVRVDGACWPTCGDYSDPSSAFEVVYQRGKPIPPAVQHATNRFACELARDCQGTDCRLPNRLRSLSRQGVEVQMANIADDDGKIRTGIFEVDVLLAAENPRGLQAPPMVLTPDLPSPRRVT